MPTIVDCPSCQKRFKAPDEFAGKRVACPACKAPLTIPASGTATAPAPSSKSSAAPAAAAALKIACPKCERKLTAPAAVIGKRVKCPGCETPFVAAVAPATSPPATTTPREPARAPATRANFSSPKSRPDKPAPTTAKPASTTTKPAPRHSALAGLSGAGRPRFLYAIFLVTLVPLGFQIFAQDQAVEARLAKMVQAQPELEQKFEAAESEADLFAALPDVRIIGAHLAHDTWNHWLYALVAAAIYFALIRLLFEPGKSAVQELFIAGLATGTIGIFSLLAFQWAAEWTNGFWLRGSSIIVLCFYVVKFIAFSYHSALDPANGFWFSFFGFTFGVGLCEELTKIIPVVVGLDGDRKLDWRGATCIGLASGVGFGVAEGIIYASNYYNGVASFEIYFTRFVSCVALHAIWTASAAIMVARHKEGFKGESGGEWLLHLILMISVPAILHGLYDTLLKREMNAYALLVAVISFAWLAVMIERARSEDPIAKPLLKSQNLRAMAA